ncbi:5-formyltetrahydrofolate cyclo-ligase [Alteromonas halophila]|uniref:5-formyltetrahydrofolate cyclo-ligase n=1 Tax=Alteromonas halophila TaxID=516698 RepID=A0A918JQ68_9ALTE|nr:5-formyltetrahydrofolate cyclo-ligase [Alteromonas halophila]GGW93883.1 5-formyltetrahydrofolate cyclo-ligase [Alteromonas halophila]
MHNSERTQLRRKLRAARNALIPTEQQLAAQDIASQLAAVPAVKTAGSLAFYLSNDGEVSLSEFSASLLAGASSPRLALPVLHPFCRGHLLFLHYHQHTAMTENRFGIPEPSLDCTAVVPAHQLDVILMPLVGFDKDGNRLGMGGGFYDRTLANRHNWPASPRLIGIAHDCQQVDALPVAAWDVPLDAIVTPSQIIVPKDS